MSSANLTGTAQIDFILNEYSSFNIKLLQWQDKAKVIPANFASGEWRFIVYSQDNEQPLLELNQSIGMAVLGNTMEIDRKAIKNELQNGNYNYEIRCDLADGTNIFPFVGKIKIDKRLTQ